MGEELPFGGQLFFGNGMKFCDVQEIPEFIEIRDSTPIEPIPTDIEFHGTFQMSPRSLKVFVREMCGWKAKGPMRTRAVIREQIRLWRKAQ